MLFSEEIIHSIEDDPVTGILEATQLAISSVANIFNTEREWSNDIHELLWESASFIDAALEASQIDILPLPSATGILEENCKSLYEYITTVHKIFEEKTLKLKINSYKGRYKTAFKNSFAYEFSQGDLDRIQIIVNELREHISGNDQLETSHKQRLLKRLENLQSELHKRVSDLDRFWGMVGDAGVVLSKLGADAKPIVDRIKEIAEIVWKTQARTEELPSDSRNPMLDTDENA